MLLGASDQLRYLAHLYIEVDVLYKCFVLLEGLEPPTLSLRGNSSNQLSYKSMVIHLTFITSSTMVGFEPTYPATRNTDIQQSAAFTNRRTNRLHNFRRCIILKTRTPIFKTTNVFPTQIVFLESDQVANLVSFLKQVSFDGLVISLRNLSVTVQGVEPRIILLVQIKFPYYWLRIRKYFH